MVRVALWVRLLAKQGKEKEVASFLKGALPAAEGETRTPVWFGLQLGPREFAIFDAFADDSARKAHLSGPIAAALMAKPSCHRRCGRCSSKRASSVSTSG